MNPPISFQRSDIVLATVPYLSGTAAKRRPVLVVQNDNLTARVIHCIVAAITTDLSWAVHPECYLIDSTHPDWTSSGLRLDSVIRCDRLFTIDQSDIVQSLGSLSATTMQEIEDCLKAALGIS